VVISLKFRHFLTEAFEFLGDIGIGIVLCLSTLCVQFLGFNFLGGGVLWLSVYDSMLGKVGADYLVLRVKS